MVHYNNRIKKFVVKDLILSYCQSHWMYQLTVHSVHHVDILFLSHDKSLVRLIHGQGLGALWHGSMPKPLYKQAKVSVVFTEIRIVLKYVHKYTKYTTEIFNFLKIC